MKKAPLRAGPFCERGRMLMDSQLRLNFIAALMMIAALSPAEAAGLGSSLYFLNGVDRHDGMSTDIDLDAGHLRIISDRFDATSCATTSVSLCFETDYMKFSAPPSGSAETWRLGGSDFVAAGLCLARSRGTRIAVSRIVSNQRHGRFEFYFDSSKNQLLGWRSDYTDVDGRLVHDLWMRKGFSKCRPMKPAR
jgi:hypothetical protein